MPLPYGRHRPFSVMARSSQRRRNSASRRDLPTPAGPNAVTNPTPRVRACLQERCLENLQLRLPPHERRIEPPRVGFVAHDSDEPIGSDALSFALELEGLDGSDFDRVTDQSVGGPTDQHTAGRRRLLQPRRRVHRVARHEALTSGQVTRHDLAGVDPDAVLEPDPPDGFELHVDTVQGLAHLGGRSDGPQGIVLVLPRQAEHRHDRVPDVFLHHAAVPLEWGTQGGEVDVQHLTERLGVELLAKLSGVFDVAEDDRDGLPDVLLESLRGELRAAEPAHAEPFWVVLTAIGADLHQPSLCLGPQPPRFPAVASRVAGSSRHRDAPRCLTDRARILAGGETWISIRKRWARRPVLRSPPTDVVGRRAPPRPCPSRSVPRAGSG